MNIHNIRTKHKGLRCLIRVINHQGDGILTTYDPSEKESVDIATQDLQDFFNSCIDQFKAVNADSQLTPNVWGRKVGGTEMDLILTSDIQSPTFDVGLYEDIMIQPVPLAGG